MAGARTLEGDPDLTYYDSGGGVTGDPPIVLAHGATFRSEDWESIYPRLAARHRVIAYDARGHGRSGRARSYALADLVADQLRMLREVAGAPAVLIGHSIGGATALVLAAAHPELVRGLVLEDPWLARYREPRTAEQAAHLGRLRAVLERRDDPRAFRSALAAVPLRTPGPRGERTLGDIRGFLDVERLASYYADVDLAFWDLMLVRDEAGTTAIAEAIPRVRCPVLLLVAGVESALAAGEADRLAADLADVALVHFPGVGHRIHAVSSARFLEALDPFLRRVGPEPRSPSRPSA